ncbi:MAG: ATP-binding protein [Tildeniella torsiva UHER 1998/13D]|jgi:hypothetical protein|nr:ATP-binding protein [Tildeniella torsiva UHER 1998/13D]
MESRFTQPSVRLRTYALAAIAAQLEPPIDAASDPPELQWLRSHLPAVASTGTGWLDSLPDYLRQPIPQDVPLLRLVKDLSLTGIELLAIALAAAVEDDVLVGRTLARVQAPIGGSRPTLSLVAAAFAATVSGPSPLAVLVNGAALQSGLLIRLNDRAPLPEQTLSVPLHLCLGLDGQDGTLAGTRLGLGDTPPVPLPPSIQATIARYGESLPSGQRLLVIRTGSQAEGETVAAAIAQAMHRRPLFIDTEDLPGLGPWLRLRRLLPVFSVDLAPGEHRTLPPIPFSDGPLLALTGPDGYLDAIGRDVLSWTLPVPHQDERQTLWQQAIANPDLAAELARHHRHGSGRIAQLGRLARHHSQFQGHDQPTVEDIRAAAWSSEGVGLDALAQPLTQPIGDDALVIPAPLKQDLHWLLQRCRVRDTLIEGLGVSATARYYPGVRTLFVGPSGTGKTLAAGWLATQLSMPLYRVDLASVVSKYIGETEKNLAQLLARAERAEVVLLFDEADSLFGKRTDVQQANDRFANAQTNYLLQRIETFDGITILTSNSRQRFDTAFSRRLDMVIEFPLPRPQERRALWQAHLGDQHQLTPQDMNQLAATADLCGGHIRNAVLTAAVLAQEADRAIAFTDVLQGLGAEYRKLGRQMPVALQTHR